MAWYKQSAAEINTELKQQALHRQAILTKPAGSLGQLEDIAVQFAAMQASNNPVINKVHVTVFAGDHGVMAENVSAFPQAVTAEMVKNFSRGGAAISVLSKEIGATLEVVNMGTVAELDELPGVTDKRIAAGTKNFCEQPAMTAAECEQALLTGKQVAESAHNNNASIFIGGEMGIGNTTTSTAMACALLKLSATELVGPGTGLDSKGVDHKARVIEKALVFHKQDKGDTVKLIQNLGGFEIVALIGAYIRAAQLGLPVIVDGFITSVAALFATHLCPTASDWLVYSHQSAEPGHAQVLKSLNARPLVNMGMRLGEGSAAAAVVCLIRNALVLHNNMATFEQAGVSEKNE